MEKPKKISYNELQYYFSNQNFSLEIYFVQTLFYLCECNFLKINQQTLMGKKELSVNIAYDFFSYKPEPSTSDFIDCLSAKTQTIGLNKFIEIVIGDKISDSKWIQKQKLTIVSDLNNKHHKAIAVKSKYFNYIPLINSNFDLVECNSSLTNIFITTRLKTDYDLFDFIYEQTKTYILDKSKSLKRWHWGKANATGGM